MPDVSGRLRSSQIDGGCVKAMQSWRLTKRLPVWIYAWQLDNYDQEGETHRFSDQETQSTERFCLLQSNISSLVQSGGVTEVLTGAVSATALTLSGSGHEGKDDCSDDQIAKPEGLSVASKAKNRGLLALYLGPYWPVMAMRARMMAVLTRLPRPWLLKTSTTVRPRKFLRLLKLLARSLAELDACIIQSFTPRCSG